MLGLGINFDFTALEQAEQALKALTAIDGFLHEDLRRQQTPQIDSLFWEAAKGLDKPVAALNKEERLGLLKRLSSNHFFEQQKAIPYLSEQLGVSRYTIYKNLKELELPV